MCVCNVNELDNNADNNSHTHNYDKNNPEALIRGHRAKNCGHGGKNIKAGKSAKPSDPRDTLPMVKVSCSHTAESPPRSEIIGWVQLDDGDKLTKVHVKTLTGEPNTKVAERFKKHIEASKCSNVDALDCFCSVACLEMLRTQCRQRLEVGSGARTMLRTQCRQRLEVGSGAITHSTSTSTSISTSNSTSTSIRTSTSTNQKPDLREDPSGI